jgi:hypothetical protein
MLHHTSQRSHPSMLGRHIPLPHLLGSVYLAALACCQVQAALSLQGMSMAHLLYVLAV